MPRAIWSGAISFGLVNVPIKLFTATSQRDVRFHQLHDKDGARIQQKRVCSKDGEEVPMEHIVKGYEVSRDTYVIITPDELDALDPKASRTIDILDFVDLDEIDPVYFDSTYYMVPEKGAAKAYALLLEAMRKSNKVAIARVVLRQKQHLVALRPLKNALSMETMLYADEVVGTETLDARRARHGALEYGRHCAGDGVPVAERHQERLVPLRQSAPGCPVGLGRWIIGRGRHQAGHGGAAR